MEKNKLLNSYPKPTKTPKQKRKKRKPTNYKKKAIELAKKIVRLQGYCDKCGSTTRRLHGSHVFSVRHAATAADIDNIICLCAYDHVFSKDSWHSEPMENAEWFKSKYPGRYERLLKKSQELCNYIQEDWKRKYEDLKTTLEARQ